MAAGPSAAQAPAAPEANAVPVEAGNTCAEAGLYFARLVENDAGKFVRRRELARITNIRRS